MKNRLEAELISIAHRVLKLKNKSEIIQLQKETLNLYEKLSVLRFVEENYPDGIIPEDIEEKLENPAETEKVVVETIVEEEEIIDEKSSAAVEKTENTIVEETKEEPTSEKETILPEKKVIESAEEVFSFDTRFEEFEAQLANAKPSKAPTIFDEVTPVEEPVFVPVQTQQTGIKKTETVITETPKNVSINDAIKKNFNIGLNDKIAFEFHLFGGKSEDFNRVLSQLNTFDTFAEAKDFIENIIKPDYNNWAAKEEFESRFLEIIENKFL